MHTKSIMKVEVSRVTLGVFRSSIQALRMEHFLSWRKHNLMHCEVLGGTLDVNKYIMNVIRPSHDALSLWVKQEHMVC